MYQFKYTYSNGIEIFGGDTCECWVEVLQMTINNLEKVLPTITDATVKADIEYILKYAVEICLVVAVIEAYEQLNK